MARRGEFVRGVGRCIGDGRVVRNVGFSGEGMFGVDAECLALAPAEVDAPPPRAEAETRNGPTRMNRVGPSYDVPRGAVQIVIRCSGS